MYILPGKSLTVFQVIKHAILFWITHFYKVLPLAFLYALFNVGIFYVDKFMPSHQMVGLKLLLYLLIHLISLLFLLAIYIKVSSEMHGKQATFAQVFMGARKRYWTYVITYGFLILMAVIGVGLLVGFAEIFGAPYGYIFYACIVVGAFFYLDYIFILFPLISTGEISIFDAFSSVSRLLKGQWVHTFVIFLLSLIFTFVVVMLLLIITAIILNVAIGMKLSQVDFNILAGFLTMLLLPFHIVVRLIQLHHLRAYHPNQELIETIPDILENYKMKFEILD